MDANFYWLLFLVELLVLFLVGLGLALLIPEKDVPDRSTVVRRAESVAVVVVSAPSCAHRGQTGRREHFPGAARGQRSRMKRI
ncbi:hypothetical protein IQ288_19795 [Burkholderia sp. R-69980]|uniref:hypothetical protein n=1 Tax=Paraburkholderia nemoris TaxID=2793076 RepID=UPI00190C650C|nr:MULTISPECIES: hypothetical protein [Paraburkholderia]MBK3786622.1 hypothetical protein [Paraburkholderia aspalathi]MBK5122113.1 hypothetical protein [Burkholderia sp. R-69980]